MPEIVEVHSPEELEAVRELFRSYSAGCVWVEAVSAGGACERKRLFVQTAFRGDNLARILTEQMS